MVELNRDPTQTKTLRGRYAQRLRGRFAAINTQIRRGVIERDVFGLSGEALVESVPPFRFASTDQKVDQFVNWLEDQQRTEVLQVIQSNENTFVRSAYRKGLRDAEQRLRAQGASIPADDFMRVFALPVVKEQLQTLYTRNFRELKGITEAVDQQVSRELADGLAQGEGPEKIARRITDRVDTIGKTRATTLARTEIVRSHADATLTRYEQAGVEDVVGKAEFATAGDDDVCAICRSLEGTTYTIAGARGLIPQHPNCRCTFYPIID